MLARKVLIISYYKKHVKSNIKFTSKINLKSETEVSVSNDNNQRINNNEGWTSDENTLHAYPVTIFAIILRKLHLSCCSLIDTNFIQTYCFLYKI
jgi:hypothetical protein